jgi:hypothetical protein
MPRADPCRGNKIGGSIKSNKGGYLAEYKAKQKRKQDKGRNEGIKSMPVAAKG